jgi:hypothetical protein
MCDGTNETPEVEIKTIITDTSPTSNNLQSEDTRNSTSLLTQTTSPSQLQPIRSSDSASTSHSSISNEAVNGDVDDNRVSDLEMTTVPEDVESVIEEAFEESVRGIFGTDVGILGYGLFELNGAVEIVNGHCKDPSNVQFRVYLHQTKIHDALDFFAYGGPKYEYDDWVSIQRMPVSPQVCDYTNDLSREELTFLEDVENYLNGKDHLDGVPIPQDLLGTIVQVSYSGARAPQYRLPRVEKLMATMVAQFVHNRFSHPTSRRMLEGLSHLVQPIYPTKYNKDLFNLRCPELPYLRPEFDQDEPRHPDDIGDQLSKEYFGCLPRKEAFIFQQLYPKFSDTIYYTAVATRELLTIHAQSGVPLSAPTQIDWEAMLDPFPFHLVFEEDRTPEALISRIQQETPGIPNEWIYRIPHIWQCSRQLSLLIQQLETFFQTLGFRGLRDLVHKVNLNTDTSFEHNALLDSGEAAYLTAAYDFLLREHKCSVANEILNILHLPFPNPFQFFLVRENIIDFIDPAPYVYSLCDGDGMGLLEEED